MGSPDILTLVVFSKINELAIMPIFWAVGPEPLSPLAPPQLAAELSIELSTDSVDSRQTGDSQNINKTVLTPTGLAGLDRKAKAARQSRR